MQKKWKRKIAGNNLLQKVVFPINNFVEKVIPTIPLSNFPHRPVDQINLSIGDPTKSPEYRTHPENLSIMSSVVGKIDGYTDAQGLASARAAVACRFKNGSYLTTADDVYLTEGASLAIWITMNLLAQKGDNFILPSPGFPLALTIARSMGLQPRFYALQADRNWQANVEQMESLIDQKTKFVLINDPSNPLGSVWSAAHKREVIGLCAKRRIPILADEIYEGMSYEEQVPTFAELVEASEVERVTIYKCSALSKTYLGPGWRLGWIVIYGGTAVRDAVRPMLRGILNVPMMPDTIIQAAVAAILQNTGNQDRLRQCMQMMRVNQECLRLGLEGEEYCKLGNSQGTIYATILLHMQKLEGLQGVLGFVKEFYAQQNVLIFPGVFFEGKVPFVRLVISCSLEKIEEFLVRFKRFCRKRVVKSN